MKEKFPPGLPSNDYFERIVKGYRKWGLNRKYLEMALVETQYKLRRMRGKDKWFEK
jgi:hypothetical protein